MEKVAGPLLECGVAGFPLPGEKESGDLYLVKENADWALLAVVDGLGHGREAASAAQIALDEIATFSGGSLIALARKCHERLRSTRGAAKSLAFIDRTEQTMTWLGVGNVEGVLFHGVASGQPAKERLLLRPGVVGDHLPLLRASVVPVVPGDLIILATDGVRPGFDETVDFRDSPQHIAEAVMRDYARGTDDALVLVVRYVGGS